MVSDGWDMLMGIRMSSQSVGDGAMRSYLIVALMVLVIMANVWWLCSRGQGAFIDVLQSNATADRPFCCQSGLPTNSRSVSVGCCIAIDSDVANGRDSTAHTAVPAEFAAVLAAGTFIGNPGRNRLVRGERKEKPGAGTDFGDGLF
jgi:hypothetical protein